MHSQISTYFYNILSKYQFGFRQGYSSQQCLLVLTEKSKKSLDKGCKCGALLTNLSKAFNCLLYDLLIAKLHACSFEILLRLIYSYLVGRKQGVQIDYKYRTWREILFGVPQGSILGPLLFNIHMCNLFFAVESADITNYADDTTPYVCLEDIDLIIEKLEVKANEIFQWFNENAMKANTDKCHLLNTANKERNISIGGEKIQGSKSEKLLGATIHNKLSFTEHVHKICDKASQKLNALVQLSSFRCLEKRRLIMKAFVNSQFDLQFEAYKVKMGLAPQLVKELFPLSTHAYNLRFTYEFKLENVKTVHYGTESLPS